MYGAPRVCTRNCSEKHLALSTGGQRTRELTVEMTESSSGEGGRNSRANNLSNKGSLHHVIHECC